MALDFSQFAVAGALAQTQRTFEQPPEAVRPFTEAVSSPLPETAKPLTEQTLRCRDLVALLYGRRVAMTTKYTETTMTGAALQVLTKDPRRIRLEIQITFPTVSALSVARIGNQIAIQSGIGERFMSGAETTYTLDRNFFDDGDAVCEELWVTSSLGIQIISVRETLLTPLPVDEA